MTRQAVAARAISLALNLAELNNCAYEQALAEAGYHFVAGCDEAGRGPLAGPVVAASVILPVGTDASPYVDSKSISSKERSRLAACLYNIGAAVGIGIVPPRTIDRINILQASLLAMRCALTDLARHFPPADFVLVDGKFTIPYQLPQLALIHGESKSGSIAAASIIAKTTRDGIMEQLHDQYPQYNFRKHKGYPTRAHREALSLYGPSPVHRLTFRGVLNGDR